MDASEEMQPLAASLDEAGFAVQHAALSRLLDEARVDTPAVLLFNLIQRADLALIRNTLRSADMPHGIATLAAIRSDQLASFDFSTGFDDFIVHPALGDELAARVRRAIWLKSGVESDNTLRAGDLHIDLSNYKAYVAGRPIDLTYKEFELLRFLATNRDKVFTREALLNRVWGYDFYGGARTVDVHVRRLRSKIEDNAHTFIETVRNVGYRFHLE
ncbi:MAG TPA: response regulator transcription factor [Dehalococcoidia bacterium]|nr:response regulator transcription factor [Dehalococcoidia bacterium]